MTKEQYLLWVAPRIVLDSLNRNLLPSPRISQACFEPDYGTSILAINANNLFGVKANDQWDGPVYNKVSGECYNGKDYVAKASDFQKYESWDESIYWQGWYLENRCTSLKYHPEIKHYAELIGNRDYKDCARILQEKCYGTSPEYAKRVIDYIELHDLTKYDSMSREEAEAMIAAEGNDKKMVINVHAGHNPDGKVACGAVGYIKESTEARRVKDEVVRMLKTMGHTVYDCTCDNGTSVSDVLSKIVDKCNAHNVDVDVSIHFNSASNLPEDGKTTGTEVLLYSGYSKAGDMAAAVTKAINSLGFKNRGVKYRPDLYFLKKTKAPAMLIECCFVNDKDDVKIYDPYLMAKAIVKGITGEVFEEENDDEIVVETPTKEDAKLYHVAMSKADSEKLVAKLKELGINSIIIEE